MRIVLPLLALGCTGESDGRPDFGPPPTGAPCDAVGLSEGDCAPDFELVNADGTPVRLSSQVGEKVVVVGSSMW